MSENHSEESDRKGLKTLKVISEAGRFNKWMFETIQPYCKGSILEIGSGIGNISRFFLERGYEISLSDFQDHYCDFLNDNFGDHANLKGIYQIDLVSTDFNEKYNTLKGSFDTVFALNVIEHIDNDSLALRNCGYLLKPGGHLIILVPAYQSLFNGFDRALGHYRRYTGRQLKTLFKESKFGVIHSQYFNIAGIVGWYVSGKLQKNDTIPGKQMKLYNRLVPVFKTADKIIMNSAGLSVIVAGIKEP